LTGLRLTVKILQSFDLEHPSGMNTAHAPLFCRRHPWLVNGVVPVLIFALFTVVASWPMARDLRFTTPYDYTDGLLNGWILRWNLHQIVRAPLELFNAPIMHPWPNTLAMSENMLGLSLLFAPLNLIFDDTLLLANSVILFSFFSLGLAAFYVFRRWTGSWWIGLIAGILIGFAPTRFPKITHFQLLSYQPAVLAVFFAARWLRMARWRDAVGLFAALAAQFLFGVYVFVFLTVLLSAFVPVYALARLRLLAWRRLALQAVLGSIVLGAVMLPIYRPYRFIRKTWGLQAQPELIVECSACPTDFLRFPGSNLLWGKWALRYKNPYSRFHWEQEVALPFTAYALAASGLAGGLVLLGRRRRLRGQSLWLAGSLAGLLCVSLMFGPLLHVGTAVHPGVPMPYNLLVRVLPGLKAIRNPVPVGGGADPDLPDRIRRHAPRSVLAFGRAISGDDYETVAAQAPGVARARAYWVWDPLHFVMERRMLPGIKEHAGGVPFVPPAAQALARVGWALAGVGLLGLFVSRRRWLELLAHIPTALWIPLASSLNLPWNTTSACMWMAAWAALYYRG
jgi:hypothetical protein